MLRTNFIIATLYCLAITFGLSFHWSHDGEVAERSKARVTALVVLKEIVELALLSGQFLNIRPRVWPQYFTLEMLDDEREFFEELGPLRQL